MKIGKFILKTVIPQTACFLACILNTFLLDDELMEILFMDSKIHQELEKYNAMYPDIKNLRDSMHQSDMSINIDVINEDLKGLLDDESDTTSLCNNTPLLIILLIKSQKRNAKKKVCKEKKKTLQLQTSSGLDEKVVPTFSAESPEYTLSKPSNSRIITFNQSLLSSPFTSFKQLK
ncbi:hypothetical protein RclHR1_27910001 [Rhizophagus clarus]|uniref:Uncharacterized protein n=1 Tax=Rhizophagus clarus TaxID=94130 RepID=A0A2Z6RF11_9GLOM|nr:hypothetical protein RclHR1_27910001 [Rhizophagus clarus]GES88429.1 hypothetical protein RCL_jg5335.t1 [Rhizophagus clarus]